MYNYKYNKENFQLYYKDYVIDASQIEYSNIWSIEIFPENQSNESFESAEFSGTINMSTKDFNFKCYPDTLSFEEIVELNNMIKDEIKDITEVTEVANPLRYEVNLYDKDNDVYVPVIKTNNLHDAYVVFDTWSVMLKDKDICIKRKAGYLHDKPTWEPFDWVEIYDNELKKVVCVRV